MSYNGSGTFNINTAGQPVVTGTVISSTAFNALTADLATGLSTAITKDGQTTTTARIVFAQGISSTLTTDATSSTTGSIITAGGISCQKALNVGTTTTLGGALTYGGVTLSNAVTGTGNMVLSASPTLSGTIGGNLTFSGTHTLSSALTYGGVTLSNAVTGTGNMVLSASPTLTGNPTFSAGLTVSGQNLTGVTGNGQGVIDATAANGARYTGQGSSYNHTFINSGGAIIWRNPTGTQTTEFVGAISYGGVTLSNSVTGTGSMVLSASPALTGTPNTTNNTNGVSSFSVLNPNAGASASSRLYLGNNQASNRAYLIEWGSGFGGSGQYRSDGLTIENGGTGGIVLSADNASGIIGAWINGAYAWYTGTDRSFLVNTTTNGGWTGIGKMAAYGESGKYAATFQAASGASGIAIRGEDNPTALINFFYSTSIIGSITTNGSSTAYNTSSDARLKDNIVDAPEAGAIIDALRVRSWDWKSNGAHQSYGFVAQEEALVYADAVTQGDDGDEIERQWGRDDSKLVPLLVKEIQSLRARLATVEGKVN